jgi:hypothetical protein
LVSAAETLLGCALTGVRKSVHPPLPFHWHDLEELYHDVEALGRFADAW